MDDVRFQKLTENVLTTLAEATATLSRLNALTKGFIGDVRDDRRARQKCEPCPELERRTRANESLGRELRATRAELQKALHPGETSSD